MKAGFLDTVFKDVVDTIRTIPALRAETATVFNDEGDITNWLKNSIALLHFGVLVKFGGFTPQIVGPTAPGERPFGALAIVVRLFEKPLANRSDALAPTVLTAAFAIAAALDGASGAGYPDMLRLQSISSVDVNDGVAVCDVTFSIKTRI